LVGIITIEHLWDELGRRVRRRVNPPEYICQLQSALTDEGNNIPQAFVMRLIGYMHRRCLAVINARGGQTHAIKLLFTFLRCSVLLRSLTVKVELIYIVVTEFNIGNGDHSVSETTVQRYLHKNRFYRRIVKKRMAE
jgi:hypothetical protein